jgi:heme oxygenase (biliverdin-producing, ferredoxin)
LSPSLAERLKNETRALHTAAERSTFMSVLLHGRIERPAYCALLRNLHAIYAVLEPALARHAAHPLLAPVCLPALWRVAAIERDLTVMHGPGWRETLAVQPAAVRYVARLAELQAGRTGLLLAHAYVRYLGDLSGGQMLAGIVAKSFSAGGPSSVAFYDFGDAAETRALMKAFRAGLSAVVVNESMARALVDEAKRAFELHHALFDQLAVACGLASAHAPNSLMRS